MYLPQPLQDGARDSIRATFFICLFYHQYGLSCKFMAQVLVNRLED